MKSVLLFLRRFVSHRAVRWFALPLLTLGVLGAVVSQVVPVPPPPVVPLATEPLYARGVRAKPTLTLALSVEFPTVGQAYQASDPYVEANEYIGYFDPAGCYNYIDANKRFERLSNATSHVCGGTNGFSGNFMNWASTSAIDILRYGLTGGDRVTDTATETVLQRAVLPTNFYNSSNFGSRSVDSTTAARAIPAAVLGPYTGTVYIANCSTSIFFGTQATGNCGSPGNNSNLGASFATTGTVTSSAGFTSCAAENGTCSFTGTKQVIYGANSSWASRTATTSIACNNATFGDPISGTAKACFYRDVPASSTVPTDRTVDAYYTTRVLVCGSSAGALTDSRTTLCSRYPNGNFKPIGNLQKYSDRIRVAAFGYLRDDNNTRYGGVLRAPMKYVGPKAYDSNFNLISGSNAEREWDESTGVFYDNPTPFAGFPVSGVTNYLNRFGRTSATPGVYKTYDPVNELYYESLRYIQGLPPTAAAVSGLATNAPSNALTDGYPVYTSWTDPHPAVTGLGSTGDYSCVKNNILTIGDIHVHYDKQIPGNTVSDTYDSARTANPSGNEPDFHAWTQVVGGFESATGVGYTDGNGASQTTSNPNPGNAARASMADQIIQDHSNYFMSGMAYWANTHDIRGTGWTGNTTAQRPGMRARTYIIDVNEYGEGSNVTARRNNQFYLAAKYGGFKDVSGKGNPFLKADGSTDNSIWQQSNGDAKTYFLAGAPQALLSSLDSIFDQIASEANSIAGGAITTQTLTAAGGNVYQASFDPNSWTGDVVNYTVGLNSDGTVALGTDATAPWHAAAVLNARSAARNIVVGRAAPTAVSAGTDFLWSALETAHQNSLAGTDALTEAAAAASAPSGEGRLLYLRGSHIKESPVGPYRSRSGLLGDIVNSGVVYEGAPSTNINDAGYASFYNANHSRTAAIYVGANDGMLHAFDASNGSELFAYIPAFVVPNLAQLTSPNYVHRSYVDATPAVGEANLGTDASPNWRTMLVSGVGGGGQGVFALDVTNPSSFSAGSVNWEFTDRDDSDLGNVVGKPRILKIRTSAAGATTPVYRWFAVFGSGVNNYAADGHASSAPYEPAIFFLDLAKPLGAPWALGSNYFKVKLPQSNAVLASGVVGVSVVSGPAKELKTLYTGDLQGNVWKLNFGANTVANATNVNVASLLSTSGVMEATTPIFIAQTSAGVTQPITMEPTLIYGPNNGIVVVFGTGKFLEPADIAGPFSTQSVYAILDANAVAIAGRGRLSPIAINSNTGALTGSSFYWGIPISDADTSSRAGWYFDFNGTGEREVSNMTVVGNSIVFGSIIPAQSGCDQGSGKLYIVNQAGDSGTSTVSTVGILGQPFLLRTGVSDDPNGSDNTGRRTSTVTNQAIIQGSGGLSTLPSTTSIVDKGRRSWRQLNNFQEIKHALP